MDSRSTRRRRFRLRNARGQFCHPSVLQGPGSGPSKRRQHVALSETLKLGVFRASLYGRLQNGLLDFEGEPAPLILAFRCPPLRCHVSTRKDNGTTVSTKQFSFWCTPSTTSVKDEKHECNLCCGPWCLSEEKVGMNEW